MSLSATDLSRSYHTRGGDVHAVRGVSLSVERGEMLAITGASGSGKSTLLRMLGCLLAPEEGTITLSGATLPRAETTRGARFRNKHIGYVFQDFALMEGETARTNVELPLRYRRGAPRGAARRRRAEELLADFDLEHRANARAEVMSGGERQRVAIARALANDPSVILADEPTGALDRENGNTVLGHLRRLAGQGRVVVVVTHDPAIAAVCDTTVTMSDGRLT